MSFEIDAHAGLRSPVHAWDPRAKILGLGALMAAAALAGDLAHGLAALAAALAVATVAALPAPWLAARTAPVLLFLSAFFLILPFTVGEPALRLGPLPISAEGFGLATLLVVKGAAIVLLSLATLGTAPFDRSVRALRDLRVPRRLAELLLFSYRYLFVLLGDLERLRRGLAARNFAAARGARAWEARGNLLGVLLVRSFERTEGILRAMEARGYDGTLPSLAVFRLGPWDVAKTALAFAAAAALALL